MGATTENPELELSEASYVNDSRISDDSCTDRTLIPDSTAPYRSAFWVVVIDSFFHDEKSLLGVPEEAKLSETERMGKAIFDWMAYQRQSFMVQIQVHEIRNKVGIRFNTTNASVHYLLHEAKHGGFPLLADDNLITKLQS
ncbi:hypothetical protein AKJ16_DCAP11869 [Drosera capensis]